MKQQEEVSRTIIKPHRVRIPSGVVGIICGLTVFMSSPGHITGTGAIIIAAGTLAMFFGLRDRLFWLFVGIALGTILIEDYPRLHFLLHWTQ